MIIKKKKQKIKYEPVIQSQVAYCNQFPLVNGGIPLP